MTRKHIGISKKIILSPSFLFLISVTKWTEHFICWLSHTSEQELKLRLLGFISCNWSFQQVLVPPYRTSIRYKMAFHIKLSVMYFELMEGTGRMTMCRLFNKILSTDTKASINKFYFHTIQLFLIKKLKFFNFTPQVISCNSYTINATFKFIRKWKKNRSDCVEIH